MRSLGLATVLALGATAASAAPLAISDPARLAAESGSPSALEALVEDATLWIGALDALGPAARGLTLAPLGASRVQDRVWIAPVAEADLDGGAFRVGLGEAGFALRDGARTVFAAQGLVIDAIAGTAVAQRIESPAGVQGPVDLVDLFALETDFRPAMAAVLLVARPETGARLSALFGADLTVAPGAVMAAMHLGPAAGEVAPIPTPVPGAAGLLLALLAAVGLSRRRR